MFAEYLVFQSAPQHWHCVVLQAVFTSIKIIYYDNIPHYTLFLSVTVVSVCQLWLFYGKNDK